MDDGRLGLAASNNFTGGLVDDAGLGLAAPTNFSGGLVEDAGFGVACPNCPVAGRRPFTCTGGAMPCCICGLASGSTFAIEAPKYVAAKLHPIGLMNQCSNLS